MSGVGGAWKEPMLMGWGFVVGVGGAAERGAQSLGGVWVEGRKSGHRTESPHAPPFCS